MLPSEIFKRMREAGIQVDYETVKAVVDLARAPRPTAQKYEVTLTDEQVYEILSKFPSLLIVRKWKKRRQK